MKKFVIASCLSGTFLLMGALSTTAAVGIAGVPGPSLATGAHVQLVADSDFGTKKDEYLRRAGAEMREWRDKLHDLGEKAEAKGHEAKAEASEHLDAAWSTTKEKWGSLQTASAEHWDGAKRSFEKASAELREKWHRIHPDDE